MAYVDRDRSRETALSGVAATVLVGGIGFVLATGLAMTVVHQTERPLIVHEWAAPTPPPPPPERTPPHSHVRTAVPTATTATIVPPLPNSATVALPRSDLTLDQQGSVLSVLPPPPPPPPVDRSSRATPRRDPGSWVRSEDYPPAALRAGQEGRTGFRLDLGADGRATACTVIASSGSDALDEATCRLLMRRARFEPARDAGGMPIAASFSSRIAWRLPAE